MHCEHKKNIIIIIHYFQFKENVVLQFNKPDNLSPDDALCQVKRLKGKKFTDGRTVRSRDAGQKVTRIASVSYWIRYLNTVL